MEFFTEQSGRYVYNSSDSGSHGRIFKIIIMSSMLVSIGILALVYYLMRSRGDSSAAGAFPAVAAIFVSTDFMIFVFLRRRLGFGSSGSVTIDYVQGLISFKSIKPMFSRKMEIRTGEINDLILIKNEPSADGFTNSIGLYSIRITTTTGLFDILGFKDSERARKVANELASIVSRSLKDMT
jgi:hypothetical protein